MPTTCPFRGRYVPTTCPLQARYRPTRRPPRTLGLPSREHDVLEEPRLVERVPGAVGGGGFGGKAPSEVERREAERRRRGPVRRDIRHRCVPRAGGQDGTDVLGLNPIAEAAPQGPGLAVRVRRQLRVERPQICRRNARREGAVSERTRARLQLGCAHHS